MALIQCPHCGKDVSDKAESCPNCGYRIRHDVEKSKKSKKKVFIIIGTASAAVLILLTFFLTRNQRIYAKAEQYYSDQRYNKAAELYAGIKGYKDAAKKASVSRAIAAYQQAEAYYEVKDYESAKPLYQRAGNYRDSKEKLSECDNAIIYAEAQDQLKKKEYSKAAQNFASISNYKNSKALEEKSDHLIAVEKDRTAPSINGIAEGEIISATCDDIFNLNNYFSSHGISAQDDVSGKISDFSFQSSVMADDKGNVNTSKIGDYTATTTISDEAGNQASVKFVLRINPISVPLGQMVNCSLAGSGLNVSINGAKKVNWKVWDYENIPKENSTGIVSVECAINNSSGNTFSSLGYSLTHSGVFKVLIENNVSAAYYDTIGPKDGQYETGPEIPPNTTKYVSMPFFINKDTSRITVLLDNKYSVEIQIS